jgi:eukaryotic-like serine/threonine-protein kinase
VAVKEGDIVGGHRVLERIGSGGMGAVYKAEHLITKRIEAMKVLPLGVGSGPEEIQRFEREIQVQARLHHPNIAALYGAVRTEDAIALTMEHVEGESLQRVLERQRLPVDAARAYARQVLDALAHAHRQGVVHCDVSPANIIIAEEGVAKLTDFGLARAAADLRMSNAGVAMGSPWYMSPEQVRGVEAIDARTDLYAVGAVLYEMLTGRKLFDADGAFAILRAQLETVPEPPSAHRREIPAALDAVVCKSLAKDPAARFQSADEFRLAIQGAILSPGRRRPILRPLAAAAGLGMLACGAVLLPMGTRRVVEPPVTLQRKVEMQAPAPAAPVEVAPPEPAGAEPPRVEAAEVKAQPRRPSTRTAAVPIGPPPVVERAVTLPPEPVRAELPPVLPPPVVSAPAPAPMPPAEAPAVAVNGDDKPAKNGNRFVRAIGKLNPFRKRQ